MASNSLREHTGAAAVTPPRLRRSSPPLRTPPRQTLLPGVPITPPSPFYTPSMSNSWSIGSIPICFDGSSPREMGESPKFPSNSDSPQLHRSPHTFGYHEEDKAGSGVSSLNQSPSAALRRKWKGRQSRGRHSDDFIPLGSRVDVPQVGLNIIGASLTQDTSLRAQKDVDADRAESESNSRLLKIKVNSLDVEESDNDDTLSLFSLSAYMRPESICGDRVSECNIRLAGEDDGDATVVVDGLMQDKGFTHEMKVPMEFRSPRPSPLSISSSQETTTTESTDDSYSSQDSNLLKVSQSYPSSGSNPDTPIVFAFPGPVSGPYARPPHPEVESSIFDVASTSSNSGFDESKPGRMLLRQPFNLISAAASQNMVSKDVGRTRSSSSAGSASTGTHSRRMSLIALPPQIGFLRETTVELHIDQEGFRTIKPVLRLYRHAPSKMPCATPTRIQHYRSPSSSPAFVDDLNDYGDLGVAEFKMTEPETYIFHHAALDSAPTLRRVTINGGDTKDYISRQASLSLKGNGVYTVQGVEDKGKLTWKFEYVVDNRRGPNGQELPGEKSFRPLSFSCSPLLLDPDHGKKIHLFQVVRKSVTPKLSSSKLKPPTLPISPTESTFPLFDRTAGMSNSSTSSDGVLSSVNVATPSIPVRARSRTLAGRRSSTPKRPGTARPAEQQQQATVDRYQTVTPLNSVTFTKARQRAASLTACPSTVTSNAWRGPSSLSVGLQNPESTAVPVGQERSEDILAIPNVRDPLAFRSAAQGVPGRIVTSAQIQAWMSSSVTPIPSPPSSLKPPNSTPHRPGLRQRPSTAANDGRPWGMI
ncbi:hypothetical protein FRB93_012880 [Tulasnella sp. JGI-2019a]|nr:hypothetical protein FRB93_012880 [Tulasnella sp. JGI-2019a]